MRPMRPSRFSVNVFVTLVRFPPPSLHPRQGGSHVSVAGLELAMVVRPGSSGSPCLHFPGARITNLFGVLARPLQTPRAKDQLSETDTWYHALRVTALTLPLESAGRLKRTDGCEDSAQCLARATAGEQARPRRTGTRAGTGPPCRERGPATGLRANVPLSRSPTGSSRALDERTGQSGSHSVRQWRQRRREDEQQVRRVSGAWPPPGPLPPTVPRDRSRRGRARTQPNRSLPGRRGPSLPAPAGPTGPGERGRGRRDP